MGIAGFIPGVTTNLYVGLEFAGHEGNAELLGIFEVSVLHNLVHVGFGLAGLALAATPERAWTFLVGGGIIYLGLWVYGLIIDYASDANFVPLNDADNWLHFALGAGMLALGLVLARTPRRASVTPRRPFVHPAVPSRTIRRIVPPSHPSGIPRA